MTQCKTQYKTEQEAFWAGQFGEDYINRNEGAQQVSNNTSMFRDVLAHTRGVKSILECGANVGMNLLALRALIPDSQLSAIEINKTAADHLRQIPNIDVHQTSILDFQPLQQFDMTFTKGVLIHINPAELPQVYDLLYHASRKYICVAEYYNPTPTEVTYRGHAGKLFKRDFAGELLDRFTDLRLVSYAFVYHRDPNFPRDDITWFLMEKRQDHVG